MAFLENKKRKYFGRMKVIALGAGQEVGKSCVVVSIKNKCIMFDCGVHMGYSDHRRFPDFRKISNGQPLDSVIDCVILSHFHLDHSGGLPYLTEKVGYTGPVYMTDPTRGILPIVLADYCKVHGDGRRSTDTYKASDIAGCLEKVVGISLNERVEIEEGFSLCAYYAGHVLGAAMFHVQVGDESVVYTGDYNVSPDRHLGGAWLPRLRPDLLITESTYGSMVGECRREREREFINTVVRCVSSGGKVLIPVFAIGRAQELFLILDTHWERMGLTVPIYTSTTATSKANELYKIFIQYTNEYLRKLSHKRNLFEFKHIKPFDPRYLESDKPVVLFSSPGMLHSGASLNIFKKWCGDERNTIIFPGYCVKGTVGEKVINGAKKLDLGGIEYQVNIQVKNLPFSAHADQKGLVSILEQALPKNVMLVHGELQRMKRVKSVLEKALGIPTYYPANETVLHLGESSATNALITQAAFNKLKNLSEPEGMLEGTLSTKNTGTQLVINNVETLLYDETCLAQAQSGR
jgi:integrator complex subunit 11